MALTSTRAGPAIYRPEIDLDGVATRILVDQIYTVSPDRLADCQGSLAAEERAELDRALLLKLGLL